MRYHEPLAAFGPRRPPQDSLVDEFGGLPWGLAPAVWPRCSQHPDRLDLGAPGRVLLLFMCYAITACARPGRPARGRMPA